MGYILPALNRMLENNPEDKKAEKRASELIRGMRNLVVERRSEPSGRVIMKKKNLYTNFPTMYISRDGGFDLTRHTGRGEQAIRNAVMLHALVRRYEIANDEIAIDLAGGIANYLLGPSHYFNYKMEFFGHVHSAGWVASGLARLGRITRNERCIYEIFY